MEAITAAFRFVGGMIQTLLIMVLGPLVLMGIVIYWLCTGNQVLSQDELSMLTAGIKLALITSIIWLPFMYIGPHVRKLGYYFTMALVMFFAFIQVSPHYVDHQFCLTMGQLGLMLFVPAAVLIAGRFMPNGSVRGTSGANELKRSEYDEVRGSYVRANLIPVDADHATFIAAYNKRCEQVKLGLV